MGLGIPPAGEPDGDLVRNMSVAVLVFSRTLPEDVFHGWATALLNNPDGGLGIRGFARWRDPGKVQANVVDEQLQLLFQLEATPICLVAVLPAGTGGNLVDRLMANVRELVDPDVRVFVDGQEYAGYEVRQS